MATFTAGTSFTDGVTGDVTAAKLNALVANATPLSNFITDRTAETSIATDDLVLISDTSDSGALNKMTVANLMKAELTGAINSTAGTIAAATIPTFTAGTTTGTAATFTSGTITTLNSTTGTITTGVIPTLASTTLITSGTGTAAAPAIVPTGDTNTGVFFPASDTAAISTAGSERVRVNSLGRVGIGTLNPTTSLHVVRDVGGTILATGGSSDYTAVEVQNASGVETHLSASGNLAGEVRVVTNHPLLFYTNNTERLRIDSSGNVGIGTASPSAQLELSTDSAKKPSTNTWTIASDARLKTNIVDADKNRCYEIVKEVPLKRYTWKNEVYSQDQVRDRSKLGWIAQDVEAVFPKAVGTNRFAYNQVFEDVVTQEVDPDGNPVLDENGNPKTKTEKRLVSEDVIEDCKDLNSDQIYAVMYGTIQKLIEKVETLESKVAALEAA